MPFVTDKEKALPVAGWCSDIWEVLEVPNQCCDSCHEDVMLGYDEEQAWTINGEIYKTCCRAGHWLELFGGKISTLRDFGISWTNR